MLDDLALQFRNIDWGEYYRFFAAGNPPLALQLLAVNSLILVAMIVRRAKGGSYAKPGAGRALQLLLIAANALVLISGDVKYY